MLKPMEKRKRKLTMETKWELRADEEERKIIYEWSEKRRRDFHGLKKSYSQFLIYTFNFNTFISFINNFNFMVVIQMILAGVAVYIFKKFDILFDVHVGLFVSPIVFPLAFSINTDFQRREKVLDDLANFKSASMIWFFCMRDWKEAAGLDDEWLKTVHLKLKSMLFHLREYLLTERIDRRKVILRAMYEDFSDTNQLIEKVRLSALPANTAIVSRVIHLLNMLCLSFERLRNVREYRSPRSIRSFNKVLIFFLPFILAPYFVFLGEKTKNEWSPYYISILVAFVFSALQGVQDKLDDPFDGMSEDDINLKTIDEWTFNSLEVTVNRTFKVGRFQVVANIEVPEEKPRGATSIDHNDGTIHRGDFIPYRLNDHHRLSSRSHEPPRRSPSTKRQALKQRGLSFFDRHSIKRKSTLKVPPLHTRESSLDAHPYANVLEGIQGDVPIVKRGGHITPEFSMMSGSATMTSIDNLFRQESSNEKLKQMLSRAEDTHIDIENLEETSLTTPLKKNVIAPDEKYKNSLLENKKNFHFSLSRINSENLKEDSHQRVEQQLSDTSLQSSPSLQLSPINQLNLPLIPPIENAPPKNSRFKLNKIGGHVKGSTSNSESPKVSVASMEKGPIEVQQKTSQSSNRDSVQSNRKYFFDGVELKEDEVFI